MLPRGLAFRKVNTPHGLLGGGLKALERLLQSFGNELNQAGAVPIYRGFDMLYEIPGQDPWPRIKFGHPETSGVRPKDLQERLKFQKKSGRLAARDASVFQLLIEVRHLLKPLTALEDPSIVSRTEEEVAQISELSFSGAGQVIS